VLPPPVVRDLHDMCRRNVPSTVVIDEETMCFRPVVDTSIDDKGQGVCAGTAAVMDLKK
jgi:hypothetical protein